MKRELLQENRNLFGEICSDLNEYLPLLKQVQNSYENLELGDFSNEILKGLISPGVNGISKRFTEHLEKQIEKLEVTSSVVKENLLNGSKLLLLKFMESVQELKKFRPETYSRNNYLKLNFISFENGTFYLSKENKEQILENDCRIYLENEQQKELYENLLNLIDAYSKLSETLNDLQFRFSYNQGKGLAALENVFLKFHDNEFSIVPSSIKYATNFNENTLKYK